MTGPQRKPAPKSTLPSGSRATLRLAFRLAARNALRAKGRSLLIICLVALPVFGLVGVGTVVQSMIGTVAQTTHAQLGNMAASFTVEARRVTQDATGFAEYEYGAARKAPPSEWVPSQWHIVPISLTGLQVHTAHGIATIDGTAGHAWNHAFAGRFELLSGRAPANADELLVSPPTLARLGSTVGGTIESANGTRSYTIVGTMRDLTQSSSSQMTFGEFAAFPGTHLTLDYQTTYFLAGPPVTWNDVLQLNQHGAVVHSRAATADDSLPDPNIGWEILSMFAVIGAFVLIEVALLSGAAFMVGARQQQRSLAVLASVGASRRTIRTSVAAGGLVLGAAGAFAGIGLGLLAAWAYMGLTGNGSITQYYGFDANPYALAVVLLFAVGACWISAAVPARSVSKFDVVAALRGARRPPRVSRLRSAVGVLFVIVGAGTSALGGAMTYVASTENPPAVVFQFGGPTLLIFGSISLELGAILALPAVLRGVSRLLGRLGAGGRMATRDLARNSGRSVPAIAVIMSTAFVGVFLMAFVGGIEALETAQYSWKAPPNATLIQFAYETDYGQKPPQPVTPKLAADYARETTKVLRLKAPARLIYGAADTESEIGGSTVKGAIPAPRINAADFKCVYGQQVSGCHVSQNLNTQGQGAKLIVADRADLAALLGTRPSSAAIHALENGGAVSLYPQYLSRGQVTLQWWTKKQINAGTDIEPGAVPARAATVPAVLDAPAHPGDFGVVISRATATKLGVTVFPRFVLADAATPPTLSQQDALNEYIALKTGVGNTQQAILTTEIGPSHTANGIAWGIVGVAALSMLASAVIALSLARIDGRRDEATLVSVGARPRTQRLLAFWQALVIAALGSVLGGLFGLVPIAALAGAKAIDFAPPWTALVTIVLGLPLLIALIAAAARRVPRTVIPDRVSVA